MAQHRLFPYLVLMAGVLVAATSSILVRLAQMEGAPSLVVAAWRLLLAVILLTPITWQRRRHELRRIGRSDLAWGLAAGVFLAVHLATWISSLEFTSVASSAALVTTNPLWVALAVFLLFGERLSRFMVVGLVTAFLGSLLITFSDGQVMVFDPGGTIPLQFNWQNLVAPAGKADTALLGDGLALAGAVTGASYFLVGRSLRRRLSTTAYVWLVYTAGMVVMVSYTLLAGLPLFGYSLLVYLWLLLLAVGPQLIAHTSFNWALAHLSATFVALAILGEPVGSAIFAYFLFGETFAPLQLTGFVLLLSGIGVAVLGEQQTLPPS